MGKDAPKYLLDFPSRGLFSAPVLVPSNPDDMRVYVCDHDTSPIERQIKTDPTNILVRSLRQNLGKAALKDVKYTPTMRRKRYRSLYLSPYNIKCPHIPDDKWPAKRARLSGTAHLGQETPTMLPSEEDLRTFMVVEMRTYLRESITRDG